MLAESWKASSEEKSHAGEGTRATQSGLLLHVVSYSDPKALEREVPGLLDDYAFTALACLDAYEATADLSYFKFARTITDSMIARFYDATSGGFFSEPAGDGQSLGVLATRRKPLQDSPTPAGNPMAAIALLRLHHYTGATSYRDKAEETLETFAGIAEQFGIFAATYGIAVVHLLESPVQVVVIAEDQDEHKANELYSAAVAALRAIRLCCGSPPIKPSRRISRQFWGYNSPPAHLGIGEIIRGTVFRVGMPAARVDPSGWRVN